MALTSDQAKKILEANLINLAQKVREGKTLAAQELAQLQGVAGDAAGAVPDAPPAKAWAKNQVELAGVLGVDRKTIQRWRKVKGNPGAEADGRYNVVAWKEFARLRGHAMDDGGLNQTNLKARQILLQNMKLEYELAILRKEYRPVTEIERWGGELGAAIRKVVTQLRKLAPALAGLSVAETEARLREAETEIMEQLHSLGGHVAEMKADVIPHESAD